MDKTIFKFQFHDNFQVNSIRWQPKELKDVKGVMLIVHGMAEHIERYDSFASALAMEGFIVYGYDQRGHGYTAQTTSEIGYISDVNSFTILADDLEIILKEINSNHSDLPLFLLGHSMGSFLTQYYLIHKDSSFITAVLLSGSNGKPPAKINFGIMIANTIHFLKGPKYRSKLMDNLIFSGYNKKFRVPKNFFNWLSRDEIVVEDYYNDELCGGLYTMSFYKDFLKILKQIPKSYNKIPQDLPLYIFGGTDDPVGLYGKGLYKLYQDLQKNGIRDITLKMYEEGRHEMLQEINKDEVYDDIFNWIKQYL